MSEIIIYKFEEGELDLNSTVKEYLTVQNSVVWNFQTTESDGKDYKLMRKFGIFY